MRYVEARITEKTHALIYRIYVTDALQGIINNTGAIAGGVKIDKRYFDIFKQIITTEAVETRTPDEIIDGIRQRLNDLRD